jgi:hypothetical protein
MSEIIWFCEIYLATVEDRYKKPIYLLQERPCNSSVLANEILHKFHSEIALHSPTWTHPSIFSLLFGRHVSELRIGWQALVLVLVIKHPIPQDVVDLAITFHPG